MKVQEKHGVTFCLCVNLIFIVKREEINELCFIFVFKFLQLMSDAS